MGGVRGSIGVVLLQVIAHQQHQIHLRRRHPIKNPAAVAMNLIANARASSHTLFIFCFVDFA